MKKYLFIIFFILIINNLQSQTKLVEFDYARFAHSDSTAILELYYGFYQNALKPVLADSQNIVEGTLTFTVKNKTNNENIADKKYSFKSAINNSEDTIQNKIYIGELSFLLPFGNYECTLIAEDINSTNVKDSSQFDLNLEKLPNERFSLSDIQLSSSIIKKEENTNSIFYKNTFEVTPNPSLVFGNNLPVAYYYIELYNLTKDINSEVLKLDQFLINFNNEIKIKKTKFLGRNNNSVVDAGALNISKLATGVYTLTITLTDTISNLSVYSLKKFFVYNSDYIDTTSSISSEMTFLSSEFATMSDEEVEKVFQQSKYIANQNEISQWKNLSDYDAKKNFLFNFWKIRDDQPSTQQNEFKNEYFKRVDYANARFGSIQREGWKTDRGRVYIIYGEPSQTDRYPNQVDMKPYEIWTYENIEGGVVFVFGDITGFSDYTLLHSTKRGELRDEEWTRRITSF